MSLTLLVLVCIGSVSYTTSIGLCTMDTCYCYISLVVVFACLGFLSPPNRGAFMTAVLVCYPIDTILTIIIHYCIFSQILYVFLGSIAGYTSARLYKC